MSNKKYHAIAMAVAIALSCDAASVASAAPADDAAATGSTAYSAAAQAVMSAKQAAQNATTEEKIEQAAQDSAKATPSESTQTAAVEEWNKTRPEDDAINEQLNKFDGKTIVKVNVEGASEKTVKTVQAAILSKPGDVYKAKSIVDDNDAIYNTGYFYDLYPSFEEVPEGVIVTYHVLENPVLKSIAFKGNGVAETTETLQKLLTVQAGDILNRKLLEDDVETIKKQYAEDGYIFAKVSNLHVDEDGNLTISINEGSLEGYKVKGNKKTKDKVIIREMRTQIGKPLNKKEITRSYQRINNLGYFETVDMRPTPGVEPNAVVLEIAVTEKNTGTFGIGAGYSSSDGVVGMLSLGDTNFRGTGDSVSLTFEKSGSEKDARGYTFAYTHPWIDKKQTSGTIRIYNRRYRYYDYDTNGDLKEEFLRKNVGGEITFGRPVSEYSTNYITLKNRTDNYVRNISETNRSGDDYADWRRSNFGLTRSVILSHVTDTRDNVFAPTSGARVSLSAEVAGFGGDFKFQKYTFDDTVYRKIGRNQVLALRLGYGHATSSLPESAQYRIGGQNTLRGYRDDQFRGNSMVMGTIEIRFPVVNKVQGAIFTDFGGAWDNGWGPKNMKGSVGFGLSVQTPVGPIRVDVGHGSQGNRVHFTVGTSF